MLYILYCEGQEGRQESLWLQQLFLPILGTAIGQAKPPALFPLR